ncbi:MAG: hypothetical protein HY075_03280, partial [Deltaproteobacteria bacterium]|nr:hypothetical protein [Deltaproteobacteria bacterium]
HGPVTTHPSYSPRVVTRGSTSYHYNYVTRNNVTIMQRTHVYGGVTVVRNYHPVVYGRYSYYGYVPSHRWNPWYYGWAYSTWSNPFVYTWWWATSPWYGYYGYYYRPYPHYYGPSYWLTDYIIADYLSEQYAINAANARANAAEANAAQQAAINEEVKAQLRAQVEENLRLQQQQAQPAAIGTTVRDLKHIYVVNSDINATPRDGGPACALTAGDLIRLAASPSEEDQIASVQVVTSKGGSCAAGSQVVISIVELQNFENDFNEKLDNGMEKMKTELPGQLPQQPTEQPAEQSIDQPVEQPRMPPEVQ